MKALIHIGNEELAFLQRKDLDFLRGRSFPVAITDDLINGGLPYEFIPILDQSAIEYLKTEKTIVDLGVVFSKNLNDLERQEKNLNELIENAMIRLNDTDSGSLPALENNIYEEMKFKSFDLRSAIIDRETGRDRYVDGNIKRLALERSIYIH